MSRIFDAVAALRRCLGPGGRQVVNRLLYAAGLFPGAALTEVDQSWRARGGGWRRRARGCSFGGSGT